MSEERPQHPLISHPSERESAVDLLLRELAKAEAKHPLWPDDLLHGVVIMGEEAGEALQACLQHAYEGGSIEAYRKELGHTGAMALRALIDLDRRLTCKRSRESR